MEFGELRRVRSGLSDGRLDYLVNGTCIALYEGGQPVFIHGHGGEASESDSRCKRMLEGGLEWYGMGCVVGHTPGTLISSS